MHDRMLDSMKRESFYTSDQITLPSMNVWIGWVVHRNSFSDCMPVGSVQGDLWLVFHGEEFPSSSTKQLVGKVTGQFKDASYILELYQKRGLDFLRELNGWFAGALIDLNLRRAILFNDRYGMERIYYYAVDDAFFFASEAKALLRLFPSIRRFNSVALGELVSLGCVLGEHTLFEGISVLPNGACWEFDPSGDCAKKSYFNCDALGVTASLDPADYPERLARTFQEIVPRYADPAREIGLSLTGGLDTRMMLAGIGEDAAGMHSYTFAGDKDTIDVQLSRRIAEQQELDYEVLRLGSGFFSNFSELAEETVFVSDGTLGVSGTHDLYFNRLARQIAPIRLTGKFGSEVLRRGRILPLMGGPHEMFSADFQPYLRRARRKAESLRAGPSLYLALCRDIPWREYGKLAIERSQLTLRTPFMDNALVKLVSAAPESLRSAAVQKQVIAQIYPGLNRLPTDRGETSNWLLSLFIRPILWTFFKLDYLYSYALPDWMVRIENKARAFRALQPVLGWHKFEQYRLWYRTVLSDFVADTLLNHNSIEPYFDNRILRETVSSHLLGTANNVEQLNVALTIQLIARAFFKPPGTYGT